MKTITKIATMLVLIAAARTLPANAEPALSVMRVTQDPADSLYKMANDAMAGGNYRRAAEIFHRMTERYPSSGYADRARYFEAYALYRSGEVRDLKTALDVLAHYQIDYPKQFGKSDAGPLRVRICQALAQRGDEGCAVLITTQAGKTTVTGPNSVTITTGNGRSTVTTSSGRTTSSTRTSTSCPGEDDEDDERLMALNALLQMDADRAMPILQKVLERRDPCSENLRKKAVFLVSQKNTPDAATILLNAARNDPSSEVRQQAVFWLSQVHDERAIDMLQDILRTSKDQDIQEKALFAISQHRSSRGNQILRDFATNANASTELRDKAIFWLGQRRSAENADFLRKLYYQIGNQELKEKILFSLSQQKGVGNDQWLVDIAQNTKESTELRKKALFWAGQGGASIQQLIDLYDRMPDSEMREQLIFVYSQRRDPAAVTKMLDIAKTDKDPELRKKAIFWLSQSKDPRVQQFLLDLINR